jgi:prefoldin subunit 5
LATLITFWKKKELRTAPVTERIIPLPNLAPSSLEGPLKTTLENVTKAREALKVLKLERQILGSAVTTIYESQTKGIITESERDQMLEKYKVDLKKLEKQIQENQKAADLYDLEVEREEATKSYKTKLAEIDARLKELRSDSSTAQNPIQQIRQQAREIEAKATEAEGRNTQSSHEQAGDKEDQPVTDAEKRIEKIREEILQAMDRLEQIEAEG